MPPHGRSPLIRRSPILAATCWYRFPAPVIITTALQVSGLVATSTATTRVLTSASIPLAPQLRVRQVSTAPSFPGPPSDTLAVPTFLSIWNLPEVSGMTTSSMNLLSSRYRATPSPTCILAIPIISWPARAMHLRLLTATALVMATCPICMPTTVLLMNRVGGTTELQDLATPTVLATLPFS